MELDGHTVLLLIDLQKAIDDPSWGRRNNPNAESNVERLLKNWRATASPIIHIRHDSVEPNSTYRPGQPGNDFKPEGAPLTGERVLAKHTGSAFVGTGLEELLRSEGRTTLVVCGVITNNSVESTVRHAGTLGFRVLLAEDACFTVDRVDWTGRKRTAEEIHALSLANLHGEYCTVTTTDGVLRARAHHAG